MRAPAPALRPESGRRRGGGIKVAKIPHVVNVADLKWSGFSKGKRFGWRGVQLGAAAGGRQIGCSIYELPPGKQSYPYHYHCANEEAIYVLEGEGTMRLAGRRVPIRRGDYVALVVGEDGAHQVINTSKRPLRYLCLSTMSEPDVAVYPDSCKVGIFAGSAPGGPPEKRTLFTFLRTRPKAGYWDGEA